MRMPGCLEVRSGWCFRVRHVKRVKNVLADDGISRSDRTSISSPFRNNCRPNIAWHSDSFERTYGSGFRSWLKFRQLISCEPYFEPGKSDGVMIWVLVDFATWCAASEGNRAGTNSGKLAAVRYFYRVGFGLELPVKSTLIKIALKGISRSHTLAGKARRVPLPVSWRMLLGGESLVPSWGSGGSVSWLCLGMTFFIMRPDEVFTGASGVVHAAHCLTRGDTALFAGDSQLDTLEWDRVDRVEVRFRGHKGDYGQAGSVIVRTRSVMRGPCSGCLLYTSPSPRD